MGGSIFLKLGVIMYPTLRIQCEIFLKKEIHRLVTLPSQLPYPDFLGFQVREIVTCWPNLSVVANHLICQGVHQLYCVKIP